MDFKGAVTCSGTRFATLRNEGQRWPRARVHELTRAGRCLPRAGAGDVVDAEGCLWCATVPTVSCCAPQLAKRGFTVNLPPELVKRSLMEGCGFQPRDTDAKQTYEV